MLSQILPTRTELLKSDLLAFADKAAIKLLSSQKELLECGGVCFASSLVASLLLPMPPVMSFGDGVLMSIGAGVAVTVLYDWCKQMIPSPVVRGKKKYAAYAPAISGLWLKPAAPARQQPQQPARRPATQQLGNAGQEARLIVGFMAERGIKLNINYYTTPNSYVYRLSLANVQKFKMIEGIIDDLQRVIYRHRQDNGLLDGVDPRKAFVHVRATMQPDTLQVNRPDRKILEFDMVGWNGKPFTALSGMTYPSREGQPVVWDRPNQPHRIAWSLATLAAASLLLCWQWLCLWRSPQARLNLLCTWWMAGTTRYNR